MSPDKAFRVFTALLIGGLLLSALLHCVLFMSDSAAYRSWVKIQIGLQLLGAVLVWFVRKHSTLALVAFVLVSILFTYINAVYVNYGNALAHFVLVPLFWVTFGTLVFRARGHFRANARQQLRHDA